jgi:hypothetical protein
MYIPAMVGEVGPASSRFIKGRRCPPCLSARSDPQREFFSPVHRQTKQAKRRRKRARRILKPYIAELQRAKVPPSVIGQASALMVILLGEGLK